MKSIIKLVSVITLYSALSGCAGTSAQMEPLPAMESPASSLQTPPPPPESRGTRQENGSVLFIYPSEAQEVYVSGEFNNWSSSSDKMERAQDGGLRLRKYMAPGRYRYMFIVNGNWITDPTNPETAPDGRGGENSLILVR